MNQTQRSTSNAVAVDRRPAPDGTDAATLETVRMMCEYIDQGIADPQVQACADYAFRRFGAGVDTPAAKCWAVFWWVKHCITFRNDEATMFRVGDRNQQDLLIAPPVLTRMKDPAEDCDGFTMLACSMLRILGVEVVIATVAASPDDPTRWSHVFPCAILPGDQVLPLDCSHGPAPGWMVPPEHTFRFQAYTLDAKPADVAPMKFRGLHNYSPAGWGSPRSRRRGMGDYSCPDGMYLSANAGTCIPDGTIANTGGAAPAAAGGGSDWAAFFQGLAKQGVNLASNILTPPAYQQTTRDAAGNLTSTTVRNTSTPTTSLSSFAGMNTTPFIWAGVGLVAVLAVVSMKRNN
jgi:hypothetical protein